MLLRVGPDSKATDCLRIDDLDDLLRYLTKDLGYSKGVAVYMMNQRYQQPDLDGQLQLTKV